MKKLQHANDLLGLAEDDLEALKAYGTRIALRTTYSAFHVQQAIEKTLKAWIAGLGREYPLTHNIAVLIDVLGRSNCDMAAFWDLADYTPYGVELRYSAPGEEIRRIDRRGAVERIEMLISTVRKQLQAQED